MKSAAEIQNKIADDLNVYFLTKNLQKEVETELELISQEISKAISVEQPDTVPTHVKVVIKQGQTFHGTAVRRGISRELRSLGYGFNWEVHKKISTLTVAWSDSKASFLE